ncbi:hypothetical protein C8R43DRAFT_1049898 [Mycena crocata]|nr:hypothetical protein C8R43DRAFT_1049898 [Mycena crocata]
MPNHIGYSGQHGSSNDGEGSDENSPGLNIFRDGNFGGGSEEREQRNPDDGGEDSGGEFERMEICDTPTDHGGPRHGDRGGGDGGDGGGGPTETEDQWESQLHRTRIKLRLKVNATDTYPISIGYNFKFTINREPELRIDLSNMAQPLSQPEVIALVDLKIETRPRETRVDRSYASIGFVAHRQESIMDREFLHRGFDAPDQIYKHGQQRQIQKGVKAVLGFSSGSPLATAALSYDRTHGSVLEATDNKVMPRCRVEHEIGDEWDEDRRSYTSYNITYQSQDRRLDDHREEFRPLEVKVGMGINLRPSGSEAPLPPISFVNRNQLLLWVSDPTSKAKIRGIVVLTSSYLDNIKTEEKLSVYEQADIDLTNTESLNLPETKVERNKPGTLSLSIVKVQSQGTSSTSKLPVPAFFARFGQRPSTTAVASIPPHEYLARGWDVKTNRWRSVLWPSLDQHFRAADLERTSPAWKIQWTADEKMIDKTQTPVRAGKGKERQPKF